jgi:uncharacterized repeat protein (TIGR01451 family)
LLRLAVAIVLVSHLPVDHIGYGGPLRAQAPSADLQVQLVASPNPAPTSAELTYLIGLANFGPDDATNVVVTKTLPAGVVFKSADDPCTFDGTSKVTCVFSTVSVTFDEAIPLQITVTTPGRPVTLVNKVSVSSDTSETDDSNNSASVSTEVRTFAVSDLSVSASATPNPGVTSRGLTLRATVINLGPQHAAGVLLGDFSSFGADVSSITPSQGTCQLVNDEIRCDLGSLAPNAAATLDIVAAPLEAEAVFNAAFVSGYGEAFLDPDSSNDSSVLSVNVETPGPSNPARPTTTTTTTTNQDIPISQTVFNPCAGEYVTLGGTVHSVMHTTANGDGFQLHVMINGGDLTGVGRTSGQTYRGSSVTRSSVSRPQAALPVTQSFGQTLRLTSASTGAVVHLEANFRVRIDDSGVPGAVVDNLKFTCK